MSDDQAGGPAPAGTRQMVVITGMSGAGRSTAAHMLEDLGWFVVDNLPPQMLEPLSQLVAKGGAAMPDLAAVVDVRGRALFPEVRHSIDAVRANGALLRVVFLDASDEALVRRFESVRRPHPLQEDGRILDGIARERELVADLRGSADLVIDTSDLNVHQLSAKVAEMFSTEGGHRLRVTVMSFGFKYGLPVDADHVVDVRFLPNPFWNLELRPYTGKDAPVRDFVLGQEGALQFIDRYTSAMEPVMAGYLRENRPYVTIAVGCTGGKHRSVAVAREIAARLRASAITATATHRDLGRE